MNISELNECLMSIVIGIRFRANFSIEDNIGKIVDQILYAKNSFFSPDLFPYVQAKTGERILYNEKNNDFLQINNSNVILEINSIKEKDIGELLNNFEKQIILDVMKNNKITQINRVGYVSRYLFKIEDLANKFLIKTVGEMIEGITEINLSFSKKYPIEEALIKEAINDYYNANYNIIKRSKKDELFISLDYQRYYEPFLESPTQIEFPAFLDNVARYNHKLFLDWLNSNFIEDSHGTQVKKARI
jgi:hypothetical protein